MPVEWDRVLQLSDGGAVGRPHIAWALIEKGHVTDFKKAFDFIPQQLLFAVLRRRELAQRIVRPLEGIYG